MGRQLRRMPMNFDWPIGEIWHGYLNPHYKKCPKCRNYGYTQEYRRFENFVRHLLIAAEASSDRPDGFVPGRKHENERKYYETLSEPCWWPWPTHDPADVLLKLSGLPDDWMTDVERDVIHKLARFEPTKESYESHLVRYEWDEEEVDGQTFRSRKIIVDPINGRILYPHPYLCQDAGIGDTGPKFHELAIALGARAYGLGWDGAWNIQKAILKEMNVPYTVEKEELGDWEVFQWGKCDGCNGEGIHPHCKEAYEAWESFEPPKGEGYQLWETTSEGSPQSPVFETLDELCEYCADHCSTFGSNNKVTKEEWLKMLDDDFVHHREGNMVFM